jgi:hypothetical protein
MSFNYWANNIFAGFKDLISSLHFMSHFIFTLCSHTPLPPPYHPSPPPITNHLHHHCHPTSSFTHNVLDVHICSMLKEAADPFEMLILTGPVKRSPFPLHPPPYNKHNINYC